MGELEKCFGEVTFKWRSEDERSQVVTCVWDRKQQVQRPCGSSQLSPSRTEIPFEKGKTSMQQLRPGLASHMGPDKIQALRQVPKLHVESCKQEKNNSLPCTKKNRSCGGWFTFRSVRRSCCPTLGPLVLLKTERTLTPTHLAEGTGLERG